MDWSFSPWIISDKNLGRLQLAALFFLSVILLVNFRILQDGFNLALTLHSFLIILAAVAVNLGYVFLKALVLFGAVKSQKINYNFWQSLGLLLRADFINLTTFPGKLISDGYKFFALRSTNKSGSLAATIIFRLALMLGGLWWLALAVGRAGSPGVVLVILLVMVLAAVLGGEKYWRRYRLVLTRWRLVLITLALSLVAAGSIGLLFFYFVLLGSLFGLNISFGLFSIFIFVYVLSGLSNLPFGLGVMEISYFIYLSPDLSLPAIITFLALLRLTGPLLVALVGWFLLSRRVARRWFKQSL